MRVDLAAPGNSPTRVVIRGRFERIVGRLIPGIHPVPVLVDAAGTTVAFANGRSGYGKDRANFEFAYPRTVPGPATFSIKLQAQENPSTREFDVPFRVQLAALDGAIAEWQVTLP